MNTQIKQYTRPITRRRQGKVQPKGFVHAQLFEGTLFIGWSLCNLSAGDTYDKEQGLSIAQGRTIAASRTHHGKKYTISNPPTVEELQKQGVAQSVISTITRIVRSASSHNNVTTIIIYGKASSLPKTSTDKAW